MNNHDHAIKAGWLRRLVRPASRGKPARPKRIKAMAKSLFPEIQTDRLYMRVGGVDDLDELDRYFSSDASRYVGGPRPRSASWEALCAGVGHWHLRGFGLWIILDRETGAQLGIAGLSQPDGWPEPELVWVIYDQYSGQGIATEAIQGCRIAAAEHFGIRRPISLLRPEHQPLVKMVERMGAEHIGDVEIPEFGPIAAWRHADPKKSGIDDA